MAENRDDDSYPAAKPVKREVKETYEPNPENKSAHATHRAGGEVTVASVQFSGPLPPPELLKSYNDAFPGCAERVVAMAERQSQHRQNLERLVVEGNFKAQTPGQYFAFILSLIVISGGVYLLANGKSIEGFSAIIIAGASLAAALIYGRSEQKRERVRKSQAVPRTFHPD
jgi:uncharacterized membrane protein